MQTYTVYGESTPLDAAERHLRATEAMDRLLSYDGYRYEIRRSEFNGRPCWDLWQSDGSENSTRGARHLVKTVVFSMAGNEAGATQEIAEKVCVADWPRMPFCMTDEAFDAMLAEIAAFVAEQQLCAVIFAALILHAA